MAQTVMVVEDDLRTLDLFTTIVRRAGYKCLSAMTNQQSYEILQETLPDLILLDLGLPGGSGIELIETIRSDQRFAEVKILVVSALTDLAYTLERYQLEGFIYKPVSSGDLRKAIQRVLQPED